jgi:hypothetical protein
VNVDHELIKNIIDETYDTVTINIIIRVLIKTYFSNKPLNGETIKEKIKEDSIINKLLFNQ